MHRSRFYEELTISNVLFQFMPQFVIQFSTVSSFMRQFIAMAVLTPGGESLLVVFLGLLS